MSQLISAYSHIVKFGGRNRGKADSFYNRAVSYKRITVNDTDISYIVRDDLLPKRAICPKCSHWLSQKQTKAAIAILRLDNTVAYCPNCRTCFKTLESLF